MQQDVATSSADVPATPARDPMPPPRSEVGLIGWARHNLFSSWSNSLLAGGALFLIWKLIEGVVSWGIVNAVWSGEDGSVCRVEGTGACWVFIKAKLGQF